MSLCRACTSTPTAVTRGVKATQTSHAAHTHPTAPARVPHPRPRQDASDQVLENYAKFELLGAYTYDVRVQNMQCTRSSGSRRNRELALGETLKSF
jgi:hypothetical protein